MSSSDPRPLTRAELTQLMRLHVCRELYDDSTTRALRAVAIYSLADPADLRALRYVGQTSTPRRRFLQHLNAARLWLADDRPWWIKDPKLRPLYAWIRALYRERRHLPTMVIGEWVDGASGARIAERDRICELLSRGMPLFNIERERRGPQMQLL